MRTISSLVLSSLVLISLSARADRLVLVAGTGDGGDGGPATKAKLMSPFSVGSDAAGNLYFTEHEGHRVRKISSDGTLTTIAGNGTKGFGGDGGPSTASQVNGPHHLLVTPAGDIYIADTFNSRVRKIDGKTGIINTFAGTGTRGFGGDGGPAAAAQFGNVYCLAVDPNWKHMYLADLDNRRIRAIDLGTGIVSTVAGTGTKGVPADGAEAKSAPLLDPRAVAADGEGNVWIIERNGHSLRVVDSAGKIRTLVGTGKAGNTGDGGDGRKATMNGPKHLCIDRDGSVLIADTENHVIRRYTLKDGKIVRVAGTGKRGLGALSGSPEQVDFNRPHGVYVAPDGIFYIADSENHRILRMEK